MVPIIPYFPLRSLSHPYLNPCLFAIPLLIISSWALLGMVLLLLRCLDYSGTPKRSRGPQSVPGKRVVVIYLGLGIGIGI